MARYWYGQSAADWTFATADGDLVQLAGGATLTMWTADTGVLGATQVTDLLDASGTAISEVVSATGAGVLPTGTIPAFSGPDGVAVLWADGGGARFRLEGSTGEVVTDLVARVVALETAQAAQATLQAHALYAMKFDAGTGDYPEVPPELEGQQYLMWLGPPVPADARTRDLHLDAIE